MTGKSAAGAGDLLRRIEERLGRLLLILAGVVFVVGAVGAVRWVLDKATQAHWVLGLVLSVGLILGLFVLLRWCWKQPRSTSVFGDNPLRGLILNLLLVVVTATYVMGTLSYILQQAGLLRYVSSEPITAGRLTDYYGWHLIDSIPVLEVWGAFDVSAPAKGEGFWAGFLVLVFRVLIVAPSIALVKRWLKMRKSAEAPEVT